jgi:hypothetical protein
MGGPKENKIARQIAKSLPFDIKPTTISIQGKVFQAPNAVLEAVYPNPLNPERYVRLVAPTSYEGLFFYNPNSMPLSDFDYTITDGRITNPVTNGQEKGMGIASGLFDNNWKIDVNSYLNKDNDTSHYAKQVVDKNFRVDIVNAVTPPAEILNSYKATYKFEQMDASFEIMVENNELILDMNGTKFSTKALSNSEFYISGFNAVISFQKGSKNNEFSIDFYQGTYRSKCLKV